MFEIWTCKSSFFFSFFSFIRDKNKIFVKMFSDQSCISIESRSLYLSIYLYLYRMK